MVSSSDKEYASTELIKKGEAKMEIDFMPLADYIDRKYNVNTMNIIYDTIENNTRPRLNIIFEKFEEAEKFKNKFGFDDVKQREIATQFKMTLINQGLAIKKSIWNYFSPHDSEKYKTENIWIIFSAFEPIAKIEVIWKITKEEIQTLKSQLNMEDLWEIHKGAYGTPTFFFYKNIQATQYANNAAKLLLSEKYYALLKKYDEMNYFKREEFSIQIDSKENFKRNYESSWFNYDRR